jgi:hypothetical protein
MKSKDVSLAVNPREVHAIIGEKGASGAKLNLSFFHDQAIIYLFARLDGGVSWRVSRATPRPAVGPPMVSFALFVS